MSERHPSDRIFTIPNVISFARLAVIPYFWWLVLGAEKVAAATILYVVVASTDWVDGYLARRLDQVTKLGRTLDPVADRLMIASAVVVGLLGEIVPPVIVYTLIARELYMVMVTLVVFTRKRTTLEVRWLGKTATFLVYFGIGGFYVAAIPVLEGLLLPASWVACAVGLVLYWVTAIQYTGDAVKVISEVRVGDNSEERDEDT